MVCRHRQDRGNKFLQANSDGVNSWIKGLGH